MSFFGGLSSRSFNSNMKASERLAQISREQWQDYQRRFIPLEDKLIDAYDNQKLKAERMAAVTNEAAAASDVAAGVNDRNMARYGLSGRSSAGNDRAEAMSKTTNIVDAQNTNRDKMSARDELLLTGGLTARGI